MPEIKHYDGKKKGHNGHHKAKRRPHHEHEEMMAEGQEINEQAADINEESDAINTEAQNEGVPQHEVHAQSDVYAPDELAAKDMISEGAPVEEPSQKVHLNFYGSEVIREKAPKVMDLADTVADEWVKDGQFEGLPVGHPLAQVAAAKVLRKAKDVEKKLEEKGVFAMAKMGAEYVKAEIAKRKKH